MIIVDIIAIGNEILLGLIQDTNSNYLCRVVRGMGGSVRHAAVVRDDETVIVEEIGNSVSRGADLIFTCGGLGPTDDDLTLAAIARAAGRKTTLDSNAKAFVEERYRELAERGYVAGSDMSEARLKMALLPEGAKMIANPVGAAPAVLTELAGTKIVSLPGVPAELKGIIEGPLQPFLAGIFGSGFYREREIVVDCGDESALAPLLRQVIPAHPDVYIKSRASHFGREVKFRILFSATGSSAHQIEERIEKAVVDVTQTLERKGIKVEDGGGTLT